MAAILTCALSLLLERPSWEHAVPSVTDHFIPTLIIFRNYARFPTYAGKALGPPWLGRGSERGFGLPGGRLYAEHLRNFPTDGRLSTSCPGCLPWGVADEETGLEGRVQPLAAQLVRANGV